LNFFLCHLHDPPYVSKTSTVVFFAPRDRYRAEQRKEPSSIQAIEVARTSGEQVART
jgi:hypothetical protein